MTHLRITKEVLTPIGGLPVECWEVRTRANPDRLLRRLWTEGEATEYTRGFYAGQEEAQDPKTA